MDRAVFAEGTINYKGEALFQVNYRAGITTAQIVRYNGVLYDIARIDNFEGRKEDLKLYCARRARQNL